jgi:hypothetical protein
VCYKNTETDNHYKKCVEGILDAFDCLPIELRDFINYNEDYIDSRSVLEVYQKLIYDEDYDSSRAINEIIEYYRY